MIGLASLRGSLSKSLVSSSAMHAAPRLPLLAAALFAAGSCASAPEVTEVRVAETPSPPVASSSAEAGDPGVSEAPRARPRQKDPPAPLPEDNPSPDATALARQLFQDGAAAYANADYQTACLKFQEAYDLVPNQAILFNLGSCELRMGHTARACEHFRKYIANGDPADPRIQQVVAQVANRCP